MVFSIEALISFHRIFKLKLQLGVAWRKFETNLVNKFGGQRKVAPSLQILMFLVLELVLTAFVELDHLFARNVWIAHILHIQDGVLLEVVSEKHKRLRGRWGRYLLYELVPELILLPRFFKENRFRTHIKHPIIFFA